MKTLPISAWEKEYAALKAQRETEYAKLKGTRSDLSELQNIRRCVDIALRADQPEQTQTRTKRHETGAIRKRTGKLSGLSVLNAFRKMGSFH